MSFTLFRLSSWFAGKNVLNAQYFVEKLKLLLSYFLISVVYQSSVEFGNMLESISDETFKKKKKRAAFFFASRVQLFVSMLWAYGTRGCVCCPDGVAVSSLLDALVRHAFAYCRLIRLRSAVRCVIVSVAALWCSRRSRWRRVGWSWSVLVCVDDANRGLWFSPFVPVVS